MKITRVLIFAVLCYSGACNAQQKEEWKPLFNGKDLQGWEQLNGKAKYEVVDGAIVGSTVPDEPNSFLTTKEKYGHEFRHTDKK
jgi:hypothetical protein